MEASAKKHSYLDAHIGKKLRERRSELNLTQEQVGDAVGITFQQVQKYEKGINRVSSAMLYKIASYLKINIAFFFDGLADYTIEPSLMRVAFNDNASSSYSAKTPESEVTTLVEQFSMIRDPNERRIILDYVASKALNSYESAK